MPLRPAEPTDTEAIVGVFQAARSAALPYLPVLHDHAEDLAFFGATVARGGVTVAEESGAVVAFLVLTDSRVDHLYVRPDRRRHGLGSTLLRAAQAQRPALDLWVFQRNTDAIAFYKAHGFAIAESTEGEGNEEREPDCRMAWPLG